MDLDELERLLREATAGPRFQDAPYAVQKTMHAIDEDEFKLFCALRNHAEELIRDARRYRWLRDLKCNSVSVSHDEDHACNYVTAAQWIEECAPKDFVDDDPAEVERMKQANSIWRVQVYPNTPIGFNVWHGATLDAALDAAIAQEQP